MVKIKRNTNGDSRVAKELPTFEQFNDANVSHISDVQNLMTEVAHRLERIGSYHDWSKVMEPYQSMFYRDLCNTIDGKMNFMDGEWLKYHYSAERHHLSTSVPDDVDLFDVIEMICDCVSAGLARSGEVRLLEIDESILSKAMQNTVCKIKDMCKLED